MHFPFIDRIKWKLVQNPTSTDEADNRSYHIMVILRCFLIRFLYNGWVN